MRAACSEAYRLREQYEAGIKKNNGGALRDVCFTYALLCMLTYAYACLRMLYYEAGGALRALALLERVQEADVLPHALRMLYLGVLYLCFTYALLMLYYAAGGALRALALLERVQEADVLPHVDMLRLVVRSKV